MSTSSIHAQDSSLLASLLNDDVYRPVEPQSFEETGISPVLIETLVMKFLLQVGSSSGRDIANQLCLPFAILEDMLLALRSRQMLVHKGQSQLGDYYYPTTRRWPSVRQSLKLLWPFPSTKVRLMWSLTAPV